MLAFGIGALLFVVGVVDDVGVVVAALLTTSIGIVVVALKDSGRLHSPVGQLTLLGALLGDVASVALLSVLFVDGGDGVPAQLWAWGSSPSSGCCSPHWCWPRAPCRCGGPRSRGGSTAPRRSQIGLERGGLAPAAASALVTAAMVTVVVLPGVAT